MKPLPSTSRGRRTRAAIVSVAADLMHRRGLAAPSMDDVLAASGTGKSQLYHYFDGKQDLTVAVLQHQFERVMAGQPSLSDPTCDDLHRWREEVLEAHCAHGMETCPLGAFVGQATDDPVVQKTLSELFERWQDAIADLVARALRTGRVRPGVDPADAGCALLTAVQGGTMLSHLRGDAQPLARALDAVVKGLSAPAA
ncbi:transcriptional regulator, TetR family [Streptosporangium subroseum]|uniref:Transcriptional regulator, TetR family n=1 Tax=Streptosporangium subroseum TaxID=106412 RepID=A0A239ED43_9ACTN|nr:TetR/AcrR family transcriptional regulator [Streptosporangium subroseum]SNS42690.1 transcriptional regulator, TetR family [Streptosporangium subroseum]